MGEAREQSFGSGVLRLGSLLAALQLGCASPAPPRPPSLHLPEKATRLAAERVGDEVQLSWVNPANTTDGTRIRGTVTAVICRESPPDVAPRTRVAAEPCNAVQKIAAVAGPAGSVDRLPSGLAAGPPSLLVYRVELLNSAGRSAGLSDAAFAAAGQAPPPAGSLNVTARRGAALVRWTPQPAAAGMEVKRSLTATAAGPVLRPATGTAPATEQRRMGSALKAQGLSPATPGRQIEVVLTGEGDGQRRDPGGVVDRTVRDAETYVYTGQRVQHVTLQGHALELRGIASAPVTLAYRDTFPPKAPSGLVAVPGGAPGGKATLDLTWEPGEESDLLGYNVYRRRADQAGSAYVLLNPEPVPSANFRDTEIEAGPEYIYRVTALDERHNESAASEEIRASVRP